MTHPPVLLSCATIALSLTAIGLNLASRRSSGPAISFTTPEDALVGFAVACYGHDVANYLKGGRANQTKEEWPDIANPKTLTVAKVVPTDDARDPENKGLLMCFISYKSADHVTKHRVIFLRKNFQGGYGIAQFKDSLFDVDKPDRLRQAAIQSWETHGKLD